MPNIAPDHQATSGKRGSAATPKAKLPTQFKVVHPWIADALKPPPHKVGTVLGLSDLGTPAGQEPADYAAELIMIGCLVPVTEKGDEVKPEAVTLTAEERAAFREAAGDRLRQVVLDQTGQGSVAPASVAQAPPLTDQDREALAKAQADLDASAERAAEAQRKAEEKAAEK